VGTVSGIGAGKIQIYRDNGGPSGKYLHYRTLRASGEVNALAVADMLEDGNGDLDIIVGTKVAEGVGKVELWLNNGDGTFGIFNNESGRYEPSDMIDLDREVLCLGIAHFDRDVYPDVAVGVKAAGTYSGDLKIFQCYGYLPSAGNEFSTGDIGEAITLTVDDFNIDQKPDIAVGTRTSLSQGTVVVLFNTREG
jgi:hypothetical protein